MENWIPVSKLGWETRHTVKFGLFGGPLFTWDFPIIGSIVKKFLTPEKIRPARHFLWRKPKKTVPRPFIDVFFRGELDSGVEIGVRNPAHGQIWAFLGTTFHLRFFQHRVTRKKNWTTLHPAKKFSDVPCSALRFLWRKSKKSLQRPFLDVIVRRKFNSKGNYYSK